MIYLDNAATTYPKSESVYQALDDANRNCAFNAGRGSYAQARVATELIDKTKKQIRELVNASINSSVVFTPSITIAINQILQGIDFRTGVQIPSAPLKKSWNDTFQDFSFLYLTTFFDFFPLALSFDGAIIFPCRYGSSVER